MTRFARFARDHFLLIPIGVGVAMIWANTRPESYFQLAHQLQFTVNNIGMALFFALLTQEVVEEMMSGGALHTWRHRGLPVLAAFGGIAGSLAVYFAYLRFVDEVMLGIAWPAAGVIDIAFSYFVVRTIFQRRGAVAFTLMLAITSDVVILSFVALRYPFSEVHVSAAGLIAVAVAAAFTMRRAGVRSAWPYLVICGTLSWLGFHWVGMHPAFAIVPIVPFVPHAPRDLDHFTDTDSGVHGSRRHLERILLYPVQIVLFLFALANAGVVLEEFEPGTWAIPLASVIGRSIGVLATVALAVTLGFRLPERCEWRDIVVVALTVATGFTFALFVGTAVLPLGSLISQTRTGAVASVLGAVLAIPVAVILRAGRFSRHTARA